MPNVGFQTPLDVLARWLSRKVGKQFRPGRFLDGVDRSFEGGQQVRSIAAVETSPSVVAVSYSHPDHEVGGRQWVTEFGLRQVEPSAPVECTILLSTNEISPRVASAVQVTRPGLVTELVRRCELHPQTKGVGRHLLADNDAEAFRAVALDQRRAHSLIVLSPTAEGGYLADPDQLASMVLGLADVITIPPGTDTFWLARVVGKDLIPYKGAVRLLYPPTHRIESGPVPTRLLTPADAARLQTQDSNPAQELFSLVVHRSNLPLSRAHISLRLAQDLYVHRELAKRRAAAAESGDLQQYSKYLEEMVEDLEREKKEQAATIESLEKLVAAQEDRERQLGYDLESVKQRLNQAGRAGKKEEQRGEELDAIASAVLSAIEDGPEPEYALRILEHFFFDRIVILPEAWSSARDAKQFKHRGRLYELLHLLASDYWTLMVAGKPDAEARKIFGSSYAAKESERVEKNSGARARRTFEYEGKHLEMMKHLKIGVKDSVAETIRVHFEWLPAERLIVIGHCGTHIPFK